MEGKEKKAYLLLGLGIGIVITNIIFYINPEVKYREMTDKEVIEKAQELGMVSLKEKLSKTSKEDKEQVKNIKDKEIKIEKKEDTKNLEKTRESEENEENQKPNLIIEKGENLYDVSKYLKNNGFIKDEKKFNDRVKERELSKSIRYGEYVVEDGASFDEIIDIITWKNVKKD